MIQAELKPIKETKNLTKFALEVLPEDLIVTLRAVAFNEFTEQERLGNKVSHLIVDNKEDWPITFAKKRVRMLFGDRDALARAVLQVHDQLVRATRVKTGRARASFRLYLNGKDAGEISAIETIVKTMDPKDTVSVVGPLVLYARKLYWNPIGPRAMARKGLNRNLATPVYQSIARSVKRTNPNLFISETWQKSTISFPDGSRIPAIMLGFKRKGQL